MVLAQSPSCVITSWITILVVTLAIVIDRRWNSESERGESQALGFNHSLAPQRLPLPATYTNSNNGFALERISLEPTTTQLPDTTAVILNWSRLPNVVRIVSMLCERSLANTIATVFVWNNSPQKLSQRHFAAAQCTRNKLKIHNSPSNIYFRARFIACAQAVTPYCFIQDDDYLVWPEVIKTLRSQMSDSMNLTGIHLLPSHEMLSNYLRTIRTGSNIHTSFAWLGHGTIIRQSKAIDFLALMNHLNASDEELKMADNYFTILSNTIPDTWFDQGFELPGGKPFSVGSEGEERNRRHIFKAAELLDSIMTCTPPCISPPILPYVATDDQQAPVPISNTPCFGAPCLLETSISLLPEDTTTFAPAAHHILALEETNAELMGEDRRLHFIRYPPSKAVDGRPDTAFCSYDKAKKGDMLSLNVMKKTGPEWALIELVLLVNPSTEEIFRNTVFEMFIDQRWITSDYQLFCVDSAVPLPDTRPAASFLRECSMQMLPGSGLQEGANIFRVRLLENTEKRWGVYEMWLRGLYRQLIA